jgi:hypothetical protein
LLTPLKNPGDGTELPKTATAAAWLPLVGVVYADPPYVEQCELLALLVELW